MENNELYVKVGLRIREARTQQGMSQADLSKYTGISLPHISDIERGKTKMKLETFAKILEALQVSADLLLRPDTPPVNDIYEHEFSSLVADCTPAQMEAIIKIVSEVKCLIRKASND